METFLRLNGYNLIISDDQAYNMVMQVAQGQMSKEELANFIEEYIALIK